jgi:hypothetical protein
VHVVHELFAHPAPVAVLSHLIEKVGSYAGFAAVIGLAVLAALYFSQARDVKRLRDWAGRAPERAAEFQSGGRTPEAAAVRTGQQVSSGAVGPAQPISQPTLPGVQPGQAPAAAPAAAAAAAAARQGAKPAASPTPAAATANAGSAAQTGQRAATPAGAAAGAAPAAAGTAATAARAAPATAGAAPATNRAAPATAAQAAAAAPAPPVARQAGASPPTGAPAAGPATAQRPATAAPAGAGAGAATPARPNTGAKVLPARPVPQRPRPVINGGAGGTGLIPPPKQLRDRPWTAPRYLALIVAGVIVLGLGGTVGVLALTGGNKSSKSQGNPVELPSAKQKSPPSKSHRPAAPPIDPSTVTVSVLNATQITGLASRFGQKVSVAGFRLGNVATASQQQRAESVVLYQPGNSRQARAVARRLGISQIEPADTQSAALAGAATVIVVVGADRSRG